MQKIVLLLIVLALAMASPVSAKDLTGYISPDSSGGTIVLGTQTVDKGVTLAGFMIEQSDSPNFSRYMISIVSGMKDDLELGVNIPYIESTAKSFEDVIFGIKHNVFPADQHRVSFSYLLSTSFPVQADDLTTDGFVGVAAIFSSKVGPAWGHLNVSYTNHRDSLMRDQWGVSGAFDLSAARGLHMIAEVCAMKYDDSSGLDKAEARFSYRFTDPGGTHSTIGFAIGLTDDSSSFRIFASISMAFLDKDKAGKRRAY